MPVFWGCKLAHPVMRRSRTVKAAIDTPHRAGFNPPWSTEVDPTKHPDSTTGSRVTLPIGSDITRVTRIYDGQPDATRLPGIGYGKTATDFFKHSPPMPLEMENVIMAIGDEAIRAGKWRVQDAPLCTHDVGIREMAQLAGVANSARRAWIVDAVEQHLDLQAAWVQGRPASSAGIFLVPGFAASLLILREFLRHLQFPSITVEVDQAPRWPGSPARMCRTHTSRQVGGKRLPVHQTHAHAQHRAAAVVVDQRIAVAREQLGVQPQPAVAADKTAVTEFSQPLNAG